MRQEGEVMGPPEAGKYRETNNPQELPRGMQLWGNLDFYPSGTILNF